MKNFSLPIISNKQYIFELKDIKDEPTTLSQPLIIKKNNQLFCNYKKIYFNPGPICPELFNELCSLRIYSMVNESLNVEINKYQKEKNNNNEEILDLYDTKEMQYMKLTKSHIQPNTCIYIEFLFPPPNNSNEEKVYRIMRELKISNKNSSVNIIIEVIFIIYPLQIIFLSEKYSLFYENIKYKLNTKILFKGEKIKFQINHKNEDIHLILKHTINSLNKNTYDEPLIEIKKSNELNIIIPNDRNEDIDNLHCLIDIYYTEKKKDFNTDRFFNNFNLF